jgi:hypothetical protein
MWWMRALIVVVAVACGVAGCVEEDSYRSRKRSQKHLICNPRSPTEEDVQWLRARTARARSAVWSLPKSKQGRVLALIERADRAINRFEYLARKGGCRRKGQGFFYVAGAAVVADDTTGIGAADDVLLPLFALGLVATKLTTEAPAPPAELEQSWIAVISSLEAVGKAAESVRASRRVSPMPPDDDCVAHVRECMASPLSKKRGGKHGRSVCVDCVEICRRQGSWPGKTWDGKDCRWWNS